MTTMLTTGLVTTAARETILGRAQLDGLLTGNTAYIDLPPGGSGGANGGVAVCFFGGDGHAAFKLPTGTTLKGPWSLKDDHYCVDWEKGPKNSCSKLVKTLGSILILDAATGQKRATVTKIVPGNPDNV